MLAVIFVMVFSQNENNYYSIHRKLVKLKLYVNLNTVAK